MSRYSLRPLPHRSDVFEVAVGWDAGLSTYFVTVFCAATTTMAGWAATMMAG